MLNFLRVDFLYHHVADLRCSYGTSERETHNNPAELEVWQRLVKQSNHCLKVVDVTTKFPAQYDCMVVATIDVLNEVGDRIFGRGSGLLAVASIPGAGYAWISRHPTSSMQLVHIFLSYRVPQSRATLQHRQYNIVFDLDDTLIFNPPCPSPTPLYYVNQAAPHCILDEPLDTPVMRPYIQEFLELVCQYFGIVRVCTLSLKSRATQIIELLDPHRRTLLRDVMNGSAESCIVSREDVADVFAEPTRSSIVAGRMPEGVSPKTFEALCLPASTTVIVDDSPQGWPGWAYLGIVPIAGPCSPTCFHNGYLDASGGMVGEMILMAIINLGVRAEGALHLTHPLTPPLPYAPPPAFLMHPEPALEPDDPLPSPARPGPGAAPALDPPVPAPGAAAGLPPPISAVPQDTGPPLHTLPPPIDLVQAQASRPASPPPGKAKAQRTSSRKEKDPGRRSPAPALANRTVTPRRAKGSARSAAAAPAGGAGRPATAGSARATPKHALRPGSSGGGKSAGGGGAAAAGPKAASGVAPAKAAVKGAARAPGSVLKRASSGAASLIAKATAGPSGSVKAPGRPSSAPQAPGKRKVASGRGAGAVSG